MLSPTITTKVKGKAFRNPAICAPTSFWARLPVPVSPMSPNLTLPSLLGSFRSCAASDAARQRTAAEARIARGALI